MPNLYPVFLSLRQRACLIVGLGEVGARKLEGLLACAPASILALDTRPRTALAPKTQSLLEAPGLVFQNRACAPEDVRDCFLVYAATSDATENRRIRTMCRDANVLCDSATEPGQNDFHTPAVARAGSLAAALSTGGQSPYLAGKWRLELEKWLAPRARLAWLMGRLRPLIMARELPSSENRKIFKKIVGSSLAIWLARNDLAKCRVWLENELPFIEPPWLDAVLAEFEHEFA